MSLGADVADHISAPGLLKNSPSAHLYDTGAVIGDHGARLENAVACALLKKLHFIEDTTGSQVALHYLRDKEKHEVDFIPLIDKLPTMLIDVKMSANRFSPSLFKFRKYFGNIKTYQIVFDLKRRRGKDDSRMLPAHEFSVNI